MKKSLLSLSLFACIIAMIIAGCNKTGTPACDDAPVDAGDSLSLVGTWEMSAAYNGFSGKTTYYNACNGNRLLFTDSSYEIYTDGKLSRSGRYIVFPDSLFTRRAVETRIMLDNDSNGIRQFIRNTGNRLSLTIDANDGPGTEYTRRK